MNIGMAGLVYFILSLTISILGQTLGYDITLNRNAVSSQSLEVYMNIITINTTVTLNRPGPSSVGSCLAPLGGVSGGCTTGFTQDLTTGITTYSIASVSRTTDQGVWTSTHGTAIGSINMTVITIPTVNVSQSLSSLTLSSSSSSTIQNLTITVTCAYPAVSLDLSFVPTGGGTTVDAPSSTSTCTSTGNTGCTDTNATSYTCDITPQYEATLSPGTYHMQVEVNLDGQYQAIGTLTHTITDTEIIVQESSTAKPNSTTNSNNSGDNKTIIIIAVSSGCGGGTILIVVVVVVVVRKRKNNEAADRERVPSNPKGNCKQNDDSNAFNNEAYQLTQEHVHGRVPSKSEGDCKQNDDSKTFNNEAYGHSPEHNQRM